MEMPGKKEEKSIIGKIVSGQKDACSSLECVLENLRKKLSSVIFIIPAKEEPKEIGSITGSQLNTELQDITNRIIKSRDFVEKIIAELEL